MKDITPPAGPSKTLLASLSLVALAAGTAQAQTAPAQPPPAAAAPPAASAGVPQAPPPPAPEPLPLPPGKRVRASSVDAIPVTELPISSLPPEPTWFTRAPLRLVFGSNEQSWALTFMGVIQADYIVDSTRSYNESIGQSIVARSDTYEGTVGRTQFSLRNTRIGLMLDSPVVGGFTPSAVFQGDFAGNQPGVPYIPPGQGEGNTISENSYYNSPTFKIRHAYIALRSKFVDVIAGQTFDVFGWQNYYLACSILGLPNQVGSKNPQLRVSHSINANGAVSLDMAASAVRPVQRDSQIPDFEGGLRVRFNGLRGITTPGIASTIAAPLSLGVSGVVRQFKVNAFTPPPAQSSNSAMGWGASVDAFIPVIPAAHAEDRGNRLSLIGSFVIGSGIGDLISAGGGVRFPTLPNATQASPPPTYTPDIDNGIVSFDTLGVLHTIDWWAAKGALQYYFPGSGRLFFSGNFTYAHSRNISKLFPQGGTEVELLGSFADTSLSGDGTLLWDATPAIRFGVSGQYTQVRYIGRARDLSIMQPHNLRGLAVALYVF